MEMTPDQQKLYFQVAEVFGPSPVNDKEMFAGRLKERSQILDAILQPGQHAVIFGERGVGKSSLANMLSPFLEGLGKNVLAPKASCGVTDTYSTLWKKIFSQIVLSEKKQYFSETMVYKSLQQSLPDPITPQFVQETLTSLGQKIPFLIVIIDEFDRFIEKEVFADTIKAVSDYAVPATIVVVGVGKTVTDIIAAHESIGRNLVQVYLERMTIDELKEILHKGHAKLSMTMDADAEEIVCLLAQGLPHNIHEIGRYSTRVAIGRGSATTMMDDVEEGIKEAVENVRESIRQGYQKGVLSSHKDALYETVLLAAALSKPDEFGFFAAADLREPIRTITGKPYEIPAYSKHLHAFCESGRGNILAKEGAHHRYKFRFSDSLMRSFIVMRALSEGAITHDFLKKMSSP